MYIITYAQERYTVWELLTRSFWCTPPPPAENPTIAHWSFCLLRSPPKHFNNSQYILITDYSCNILYTIQYDSHFYTRIYIYRVLFHPSATAVLRDKYRHSTVIVPPNPSLISLYNCIVPIPGENQRKQRCLCGSTPRKIEATFTNFCRNNLKQLRRYGFMTNRPIIYM